MSTVLAEPVASERRKAEEARLSRKDIIKAVFGELLLAETRIISESDVELFAKLFGDYNRIHFSDDYARSVRRMKLKARIVHGMHPLGLISGIIGMQFPEGSQVYRGKEEWLRPIYVNQPFRILVAMKEPGLCRNTVQVSVWPVSADGVDSVAINAEFIILLPKS